jgi:hypothetical protein
MPVTGSAALEKTAQNKVLVVDFRDAYELDQRKDAK